MSATVADHLLERLATGGVRRIYGYPGDGINGIVGALDRAGGGIDDSGSLELVQVRHEEMAALMACAHAKFTGQLGVCLATSGPGAIHLLNGLYDHHLRPGQGHHGCVAGARPRLARHHPPDPARQALRADALSPLLTRTALR